MKRITLLRFIPLILMLCLLSATFCSASQSATSFTRISMEEANKMMEADDGHVIVDVRTEEEYASGHIPGAICIPNETIYKDRPSELPDLDQIILVYCRSGNRSKRSARMLYEMGYTNVYEFGGIIDWDGEIEYTDGMSETEQETEEDGMKLFIEGEEVPVTWEKNSSTEELKTLLPLTIQMSMYGGFEQVGPIGRSISAEDAHLTTKSGDIVLYAKNQIVIFYGSNSWAYTKLGHINLSEEDMTSLLGSGDVTVEITKG